jgi:hypothetical protein
VVPAAVRRFLENTAGALSGKDFPGAPGAGFAATMQGVKARFAGRIATEHFDEPAIHEADAEVGTADVYQSVPCIYDGTRESFNQMVGPFSGFTLKEGCHIVLHCAPASIHFYICVLKKKALKKPRVTASSSMNRLRLMMRSQKILTPLAR